MSMLFHHDIPRRNFHCKRCNVKFVPGSEYLSVLVEEPKTGFARHDYCPGCWNEREEEGRIQWKSKIPERKQEALSAKEQIDRAIEVLQESLQDKSSEAAENAFVLGMYLKRQKKLIWKQEAEEEGVVADLYQDAETEDMLFIPRIQLSGMDVAKVQERIAGKIRGEEPEAVDDRAS